MELMQLNQTLQDWYRRFKSVQSNFVYNAETGGLSPQQLGIALQSMGINLDHTVLPYLAMNIDLDQDGTIEFDEFLLVVLECDLYCRAIAHRRVMTGCPVGPVPMDEGSLLSLVFSVPRF